MVGIVYQRLRSSLTRQLRLSSASSDTELGPSRLATAGRKRRRIRAHHAARRSRKPCRKVSAAEAFHHRSQNLEEYEATIWTEAPQSTGEKLTVENLSRLAAHIRGEFSKVMIGQREVIDQLVLVLVCGGHALMEGVPGIGKTLAVKTLARICGLGFQRVQCTADLMPADVIGTNIFNMGTSTFSLHRGPVFTDLLLVDEINRTSPRTQAALLESMEERQVTIDGTRYPLSGNFTVLATQNPIEFEGTYPLPEAQLDRFLLKIRVAYPSEKEEAEILARFELGFDPRRLDEIPITPIDRGVLEAARSEIAQVSASSRRSIPIS